MSADTDAAQPAQAALPDVLGVLRDAVARIGGSTRANQEALTRAVARTLRADGVLLAQAGTGTGKSLAYLAAALTEAALTDRRVVISTATLALQRQILQKDAPVVCEALAAGHRRLTIALLKGWQNYVCLHKLAGGYPAEDDHALFELAGRAEGGRSALADEVLAVRAWAEDTDTGDRDDLVPGVSDRAWRQVSISKLECLGSRCPLRDDCFPEAAREAARQAEVVITNHTLLGIAATGSPGVLPEHDALVVDEAHELVARATAAATVELSPATLDRAARAAAARAREAVEPLQTAATALRLALDTVPDGRLRALPDEVVNAVVLAQAAAREGYSLLSDRGADADDAGGRAALRSQLTLLTETCDRLLSDALATRRDVAWVTRGRDSFPPRLHVAPLHVGAAIGGGLFAERAVVATSATLALGGSFDPVASMLGLSERTWEGADYGSPFDHAKQGILYLAAHLPPPGRDGVSEQALDELGELVEASGGGALGLFSSMAGAQRAAAYLRARLDTPVLCQGDDGIPNLIASFRADWRATLVGTLSLWQGVDVPGDACRLVVMDRIPFPRPDDPIMSARAEAVAARGGNGFMQVSVPHAALLLSQGAGRLIRSAEDRGVVAVLDSRLVTARYGEYLRRSLPPFWPTRDGAVARSALARLRDASHRARSTDTTLPSTVASSPAMGE